MKSASLNFHDSGSTALIDDYHKTLLDIINCQKSGFRRKSVEFALVQDSKIQLNQLWYRLRVPGSQLHIPTQKFLKVPGVNSVALGRKIRIIATSLFSETASFSIFISSTPKRNAGHFEFLQFEERFLKAPFS